MKKRELLKLGSLMLGTASLGAISGYGISSLQNKNEQEAKNSNAFSIEPKQTAQYEYSSPMPFNKKLIDELYDMNQTMTKGKITTLFSSFPSPLGRSIHPVLDSIRGDNYDIKKVEDYTQYIKYAKEKGFDCTYVLNTTKPIPIEDIDSIANAIAPVFHKLYEAGISAVKISNPSLLSLFSRALPFIDLHLSTTSEYHHVQVFQNAINTYPGIKLINIATDDNHNFEFLDSMRKLFPNIKLEILTNEARCVKNCIARPYHQCLSNTTFNCAQLIYDYPCTHFIKNNLVYPWQLEYYSAIGVNNFKFTSLHTPRNSMADVNHIRYYLACIENGVDDFTANDVMDKIMYGMWEAKVMRFKKNYKLSKFIKEYMPDVRHFVKQGARCASDCGIKCRYCYQFIEKLEKFAIRV